MEASGGMTGSPRIDSFMAADWAEAMNGKLYVMGGGWDAIAAPRFPHFFTFAFGAILRIPWNDTNRRLPVGVAIVDEQRETLGLWELKGEVEAGRAPGTPRGSDVTVVMAGPIQFGIQEAPAELPFAFWLRLQFVQDERMLALRIMPPPGGVRA